jgi:hypothetical protein
MYKEIIAGAMLVTFAKDFVKKHDEHIPHLPELEIECLPTGFNARGSIYDITNIQQPNLKTSLQFVRLVTPLSVVFQK